MLSLMVVKINCHKWNEVVDVLNFILRNLHQFTFINVQLTKVQIKIILIRIQLFVLWLRCIENADRIIIFNRVLLKNLILFSMMINIIHWFPFIESCFGDSEFLFDILLLPEHHIKTCVCTFLQSFEFNLSFFEMGKQFNFIMPKFFCQQS